MRGTQVLIGTTKGAFLLHGSVDRDGWTVSGPHCDGWPIHHVIGDPETGHLWAGGGGDWSGTGVWRSTNGGETWTLSKLTKGMMDDWAANDPDFAQMIGWTSEPTPFGEEFSQVWSMAVAHGVVYAGTKPAGLLASHDGGITWQKVSGLTDHPSRPDWNSGAAGLILHSIVPSPDDPRKMWVGISAAGVFATVDGGAKWERRNRLANAAACTHHHHPAAPKDGETGHCVHNIAHGAGQGDLLYQQNHHGVWRSVDGGRSWEDVTDGLPSTFGFPIGAHPRDPQTAWTIPLNGDTQGRFPPEAAAAVWRTRDGGQKLARPAPRAPTDRLFFTVLRQAMAVDPANPAGVHFGTNSGSVFASFDEGDSWHEIACHLPTIQSVEVLGP